MIMTKIGKVVLIASIALFSTVGVGCTSHTNPETGEKTWTFAPAEAVKNAVATVKELPDETKANIFDGLGWLLGSLGVGAAAVPFCKTAANFYRGRKKTKEEADKPQEDQGVA